jgi:hypothetical protein
MTLLGLPLLVINSDTYSGAQKSGRDLWVEARTQYTMILLSLEELTSRQFTQLLEQKEFSARVCMLGVDKYTYCTGGVGTFSLLFSRFSLCVHVCLREGVDGSSFSLSSVHLHLPLRL